MLSRTVCSAPIYLAVLCVAVALSGCLERKEEITVHADGAVDVRHEISGDRGDFVGPARLPSSPLFAVREFERKRQPEKPLPAPRRRRKKDPGVIEFFK